MFALFADDSLAGDALADVERYPITYNAVNKAADLVQL